MKDKPSATAGWVALWRGASGFDEPSLATDPIAERLVPAPWSLLLVAARRGLFPMALLARAMDVVTGGRSKHMAFRTRAIDDAIERAIEQDGVRQLVVVGAGLDARAFRLPALRDTVVFEIDHPATQNYKRRRVAALSPCARAVHFVEADLEGLDPEALDHRLAAAGHDASQPSVFVCEGLTMYLTDAAIDTMLEAIAWRAAPTSTLLVTYYEEVADRAEVKVLATIVGLVREPFRSMFAPRVLAARLSRHGFEVAEDVGDPEWSRALLGRDRPWSWERLARAIKAEDLALRSSRPDVRPNRA